MYSPVQEYSGVMAQKSQELFMSDSTLNVKHLKANV